jgi:hypothetical protein
MTFSNTSRASIRAAAIALGVLALGACGTKSDRTTTDTATASGTIAPSSNTVQVADVTLGRSLAPDKRVATQSSTFGPRDTVYASVHTTGSAPNTNVTARWTFQDGQVVNERTEAISPSGDAYTEFHISKPTGWPAGKYTLHVLVNGQEAQTKDFTVQ